MARNHPDEGGDHVPTVVGRPRALGEDMAEELTERPTEAGAIETEPVAVSEDGAPPPSATGLELDDIPRPSKPVPMYPVEEARCPKCGAPQPPGGASCVKCGVIFKKAHLPAQKPPPRKEPAPARGLSGVLGPGPERRGASFWVSVPHALAVPFLGAGVVWLPLMMIFLVGARFTLSTPVLFPVALVLVAIYFGLLGAYFTRAFRLGMEGTPRAPDLPDLADPKNDYLKPSFALTLLALALFAVPFFALDRALHASGVAHAASAPAGPRVEEWDPSEPFRDGDKVVTFKPTDAPRKVRRADGEDVTVDPGARTVTYAAVQHEPAPSEPRRGHWLLVALVALVPLAYWPMALSLAALAEGKAMRVLNPAMVLKAIIKGGRHYAFVAALGGAIVIGGTGMAVVAALSMSTTRGVLEVAAGLVAVMLGLLAYVTAVQGYLMGRLIERRHVDLDRP